MKRRTLICIGSCVLALALLCAACAPAASGTDEPAEPVSSEIPAGSLRLGLVEDARAPALRDLAERYTADRPQVSVEIVEYPDAAALEQAVRAGELELFQVTERSLGSLREQGLLLELSAFLRRWPERVTLSAMARQVMHSLGGDKTYLIPFDIREPIIVYRLDRFKAYNDDKPGSEMAFARSWAQILNLPEQLGDEGLMAFAGKDRLAQVFDSVLWSTLGPSALEDPALGYFTPGATAFTDAKAYGAAEQFAWVMQEAVLPECLDWDEEQALAAFLDGRAGVLLADREALAAIARQMEPEQWTTWRYPKGNSGKAVFSPDSFEGWAIAAGTERAELAWDLLSYLSNTENNTRWAVQTGALPLHSTALEREPALSEGNLAPELLMLKKAGEYSLALPHLGERPLDQWRETEDALLRQCLAGELETVELLVRLDAYWTSS